MPTVVYVVLAAVAAAVLLLLLVRRRSGPDVQGQVERFRSLSEMTSGWSRQAAARPGVGSVPVEHAGEAAEPPAG